MTQFVAPSYSLSHAGVVRVEAAAEQARAFGRSLWPRGGLVASLKARLDAWSQRVAQARAEERLWALARIDARIMADLQVARDRAAH